MSSSWFGLVVLVVVGLVVLLVWTLVRLPKKEPVRSARYRADQASVAHALDMQWPADATEKFVAACDVTGRGSLFMIAWRGRDYNHAQELFNLWRQQMVVTLDRSVLGDGPGRFDWTPTVITWHRMLPEPDGGSVAPHSHLG